MDDDRLDALVQQLARDTPAMQSTLAAARREQKRRRKAAKAGA